MCRATLSPLSPLFKPVKAPLGRGGGGGGPAPPPPQNAWKCCAQPMGNTLVMRNPLPLCYISRIGGGEPLQFSPPWECEACRRRRGRDGKGLKQPQRDN